MKRYTQYVSISIFSDNPYRLESHIVCIQTRHIVSQYQKSHIMAASLYRDNCSLPVSIWLSEFFMQI